MKLGPRFKLAKRLGAPIFEKTQTQKFAVSEARSKNNKKGKRPATLSDFGKQFREKQKVRFAYGITEKQLQKYIHLTITEKDSPSALFAALETRADNAIYRLGLAKTRRMARQMVAHGHIMINGRRITTPSYALKINDVISVREGSKDGVLFQNADWTHAAQWFTVDTDKREAKISTMPVFKSAESMFDFAMIFEFYTR
jgi:small subunit ribosomal protein S4